MAKHKAFERVCAKRLADAVHALHLLAMCANRERYAYAEEDVSLIKREISREIRDLFAAFDAGISSGD